MKWRGDLSRVEMNAKITAPLTALHATGRSVVDVGEKNTEGRHVGLDFYDLLIEDANQCMFCGLRYRILRRVGRNALACLRAKQNPNPSTKDEAQLNCVALRPQLDYEVAWRSVKGRDERQKTAPLTALHAT